MARKQYLDEDVLRLLREIEPSLASGSDVATACRTAGVSDATYTEHVDRRFLAKKAAEKRKEYEKRYESVPRPQKRGTPGGASPMS